MKRHDQSTIVRPKHHHEIAIVPTACGIETVTGEKGISNRLWEIAIVPTACGIETLQTIQELCINIAENCNSTYRLRY